MPKGSGKVRRRSAVDPYASGMIEGRPNILRNRIKGGFVGVLDSKRFERGLALIHAKTRSVRRYDVHELIITDEMEAVPGGSVERCFGVGFIEFAQGGQIVQGDVIEISGNSVADVVGFDETHAPNHLNIVGRSASPKTGIELGVKPGDSITFVPHWREED